MDRSGTCLCRPCSSRRSSRAPSWTSGRCRRPWPPNPAMEEAKKETRGAGAWSRGSAGGGPTPANASLLFMQQVLRPLLLIIIKKNRLWIGYGWTHEGPKKRKRKRRGRGRWALGVLPINECGPGRNKCGGPRICLLTARLTKPTMQS